DGSTVTVYPKWESLESGAPVSASVVQYKIMNGFGTGGTKTLKLYSASAGQGSVNLNNASGNTYLKDLAANEKINLIIRFRYKATDAGNGVKMSFDIAAPGSEESLSVEKGTSSSITFGGANTNNDSLWHTASLPVSLTRNGDSPDVDVTLKINFLASSSFGGIYLDDFCVFDAGEKPVSMFDFISKDFVDPIAGVVGTDAILPQNPVALRSVGGWYNDPAFKQKFGDSGETKAFLTDCKTLYGESLTYDGFYATERFDNSTKIYVDRMTSSSSLQYLWDRYGLYGKMRIFSIAEEACHDESGIGYALRFDSRAEKYASDPAASILLTNGINEQIKLGNTHDEEEKMYIVKYWYKIAETSTDLTFSVSACNYNSHWEGLNCENEVYQYPVLNESDGKWHQMTMLLGLAGDTEKKDIYLRFSVTGQALIYFDDFEVTEVKSGRGQTILFDTNGGNFIEPYVGEEGDTIPPLPTPKKENSIFKGWFTDYGFTTPFTQQKFGHSNIYLNALWEEIDDTNGKSNNSGANYGIYVDSTGCRKQTYFVIDKSIPGIEYGQYIVSFDCLTVKSDSGSKIQPAISGASGESVSSGAITDFTELEWQSYTLPISNDKKGTNLKFYLGPGFEGYIDNVVLKDSNGKVVARFDFDSDRDISIIVEDESGLSAYLKECPTAGEDMSDIDLDMLQSDDSEVLYEDIVEEYPVKYNKKKTTIQKVRVYDGISPLWIVLIVAGSVVVAAGITILLIILIKKKKPSKKAGV
ncbi:MAG: InlB B-repeat-containing protein, partial [Clostridia bacterium]|nr:InlB B-repeat-containing protein [Clostridia bacterium]